MTSTHPPPWSLAVARPINLPIHYCGIVICAIVCVSESVDTQTKKHSKCKAILHSVITVYSA